MQLYNMTSYCDISNAKSRSYNMRVYDCQIDVKVDKHLSSATADVHIEFQSDTIYKLQFYGFQASYIYDF